jgi:hypothetical protein
MCTSASISVIFIAIGDENEDIITIVDYFEAFFICISQFLFEATAFATCILSVCRSIKVYNPFYEINSTLLVACTVIFFSYLLVREVAYFPLFHFFMLDRSHTGWKRYDEVVAYLVMGSISAIMTTVAISNVVCSLLLIKRKLVPSNNSAITNNNVEATITVIIVSILFLLFNMTAITTTWIESTPQSLYKFGQFLAVSLNSALNPVVYFLRKNAMRQYLREIFIRGRHRNSVAMRQYLREIFIRGRHRSSVVAPPNPSIEGGRTMEHTQ